MVHKNQSYSFDIRVLYDILSHTHVSLSLQIGYNCTVTNQTTHVRLQNICIISLLSLSLVTKWLQLYGYKSDNTSTVFCHQGPSDIS
jgi:hypothetical protein